jgi:hypothetical protein
MVSKHIQLTRVATVEQRHKIYSDVEHGGEERVWRQRNTGLWSNSPCTKCDRPQLGDLAGTKRYAMEIQE